MKTKLISVLIMTQLALTTVFATGGTKLLGYDAKTAGRAGVSFALFDSPTLMMTNPAGISFIGKSVLDANFSLMIPKVGFSNSINPDAKGETNYFPMPSVGYINSNNNSDFTWGLGLYTQGGMGADFSLNHALYRNQDGSYNPQEYHSKLAVMQFGPSVAYKIAPNFSVGISANLVYSMLEFKMPYSLSPSVMKGVVNPSTGMTFGDMFSAPPSAGGFGYDEVTALANMTNLTAIGFEGKIGFAYKLNDQIAFGLSYTSASTLKYKKGKATMDMTAQLNDAFGKAVQGAMSQGMSQADAQAAVMGQFAGMGIDLSKGAVANYDLENELKLPQMIGFGASYKPTAKLALALDLQWANWKKAFDKMSISLSNGDNANINTMLGNNGSFTLDFPMDWKDAVMVRIGAEYMLNEDITLRGGYAYGSNPVPSSTIFPVFPAIVENHITLGGSYNLMSNLTVNAAYELVLNKDLNADSASKIANEYNNSVSSLSENLFHLSVSYSFN
ncbi:MAG: outer membrane protein transport protein [Ignavibacteriaceae bacterium]